jgi:hypothetical protein
MIVRELVTSSLRLLGVLQSGEQPSTEEAADGLEVLNTLLNGWGREGIDLEFLSFTSVNDEIPYPEDHLAAFRFNFAVELAPEYGVQISNVVAGRAGQTLRALRSQYSKPDLLTLDPFFAFAPNKGL